MARRVLDVGGVVVGDVPSWRVDHMPYGGVKDSGIGREMQHVHPAQTLQRLQPEVGALYAAGVSLMKPQGALTISSLSSLSPSTRQALRAAAISVVAEMFQGGLVTPTSVAERSTGTTMSPSLHDKGIGIANDVERRGAVLLKNDGFFPLASTGSTTILAFRDLTDTCLRLARTLTNRGLTTNCSTFNLNLSSGYRPFTALSAAATSPIP